MSSYQLASRGEESMRRGPKSQVPDHRREHILVVDDETAIRSLLVRALSQEGYLVDVAADGEEAWQALQERYYDGVIVDLRMPRLGGQELYDRLVSMNRGLARSVIFMTGDTVTGAIRDVTKLTGNPLIEKPFDVAQVKREIRRVLETELASDHNG